jgi:hypothetical protein
LSGISPHYLTPHFTVAGLVVLDVFNLATLPANRLGTPIATLTKTRAVKSSASSMSSSPRFDDAAGRAIISL